MDYGGSTSCTIEWPEAGGPITAERAFIWYAFTLAFALPVLLISIFYSLVVVRLRSSGRSSCRSRSAAAAATTRHRRVTRMVLTVITVYVVCWLPYWVFQVRLNILTYLLSLLTNLRKRATNVHRALKL